jgi:hypothetical protein
MENIAVKAKPQLTMNNTIQDNSLLTFDLPVLIEKLKGSRTWAHGELNAKILLKSTGKQIVLTALHRGTEIQSYQSGESVTLQIIEGCLMFQTNKEYVRLEKGQLLTLYDKVAYCLTSAEDTVFLLTVANRTVGLLEN